jgi:hypothetical protein
MPIASTGQITIVDNNDARPLTAFIAVTPSTQQVYTKDESTTSFTPDWTTQNSNAGIRLEAFVYVGKASASENVTGQLTNRKFSYTVGGTALASGAADATYWNDTNASAGAIGYQTVTGNNSLYRIDIRSNLKPGTLATTPLTIYFEGDYTDPVTGLVSKVIASVVLSQVKTGTNATFIQLRMPDGQVLEADNPSNPKTSVRVFADLLRANGVDDTSVTYKWFESPHGAANQIDGNLANITTKYGLLDTAAVNANRTVTIGQYATTAGSTSTAITLANVPDGTYGDYKGLSVHASAVTDIGVFKVEARDADGTVYQTFFTLYDIADPYEVRLVSSGGDKLQNGVGSTTISPDVFYGEQRVTNLTNWTFGWEFYDNAAQRGGFVDTTRTAAAGGRNITSNTTSQFVYDGAAITFAAGDIIKCTFGSKAEVFEVGTGSTGNTVVVRSPTTNAWIPAANFTGLTANEFQNGKLFVLLATRSTNGANNNISAAAITLTGDDIDGKGTVICTANSP